MDKFKFFEVFEKANFDNKPLSEVKKYREQLRQEAIEKEDCDKKSIQSIRDKYEVGKYYELQDGSLIYLIGYSIRNFNCKRVIYDLSSKRFYIGFYENSIMFLPENVVREVSEEYYEETLAKANSVLSEYKPIIPLIQPITNYSEIEKFRNKVKEYYELSLLNKNHHFFNYLESENETLTFNDYINSINEKNRSILNEINEELKIISSKYYFVYKFRDKAISIIDFKEFIHNGESFYIDENNLCVEIISDVTFTSYHKEWDKERLMTHFVNNTWNVFHIVDKEYLHRNVTKFNDFCYD